MKTILVFGVSGVGKSWLCRQASEVMGARHISGSELIRVGKERVTAQSVSQDSLRTDQVIDNQTLLLDGYRAFRSQSQGLILFDGHNVIDTDAGLVRIPPEVILALEPAAIAVITADPMMIVERRTADTTRARPGRSLGELAAYQALCVSTGMEQAGMMEIPFRTIASGDTKNFLAFARTVFLPTP